MFKSTLSTPNTAPSAPAVAARDVRKVHGRDEGELVALDGVSVGLAAGSFTEIMGPSDSGNSTFLNVGGATSGGWPPWSQAPFLGRSACPNRNAGGGDGSASAPREPPQPRPA
jgi:hypothetical protein